MVSIKGTTAPTLDVEGVQGWIRPRPIDGISALLLPYRSGDRPDWTSFADSLARTATAGLTPAVNMDTGYVHLLSAAERAEVLRVTSQTLGGRPFVAGAFVEGQAEGTADDGRPADLVTRYCHEGERIRAHGGTPVLFQCSTLTSLADHEIVGVYREVAERVGPILGFELGQMFAPFGRIYSLDLFAQLLQVPGLIGLKHSSLDRGLEWQRLALRDRIRPEFKLYTGNDLAIDMVIYGSDYLLGLSTFAPEAFGLRDRLWAAGDSRFFILNDVLQYLGAFAFRTPVPAYKHSAAQFLYLRGHVAEPVSHPRSPARPETDLTILQEISRRLDATVEAIQSGR